MTTTYDYSVNTLRLTKLNTTNLYGTDLQKFEYTYDDVGNVSMIGNNINSASQSFQYDDLNRLVKATGSYTPTDPAYTWNECSFDTNGNMLSSPGKEMTYDIENRLNQVKTFTPESTITGTVSFTYDYAGTRINKNVNSGTENTTYVSDLYEIKEAEGDTTGTKYIYATGMRVASKSWKQSDGTKKLYYYHGDHLGSSNIITDENGELAQLLEYMPYGLTNTNEGTVDVDYKFTGKELDDSTGLYYYGARYYDPVLGRFITPDSIVQAPYDPQSLNRYAYCRNNPVKYVDPTGHEAEQGNNLKLSDGNGEGGGTLDGQTGPQGGESKCFGDQSTPQGSGNTTSSSPNGGTQEGETSNSKKMENEGDKTKKEEEKRNKISIYSNKLYNYSKLLCGSIAETGATSYGNWAATIKTYAPGWTKGIAKATNFQSAFQGLNLLMGFLGYTNIINQAISGDISQNQADVAVAIHTMKLMAETSSVFGFGAWGFSWGGPYGSVTTAVVGGGIVSTLCDKGEGYLFNKIGVK